MTATLSKDAGLLGSRYEALAPNTIDYWMRPEEPTLGLDELRTAIENAPVLDGASLGIYVHVPFCAQRCRFCAFSGGNSLAFSEAERYARLVADQLRDLHARVRIRGQPVRSVNIGGGSPDLLGRHIGTLLRSIRELPGVSERTEISVELALSTTEAEFIEELVRYEVTKVSFGIQSFDPAVRRFMRQPRSLEHLDRVLRWIDGRIPVVNADLITGLPGQSLRIAAADQRALMEDERISAVSSYLLTPGAAPSLLAGVAAGELPAPPPVMQRTHMRLNTYGTFQREGWLRRGTNTYVDPRRVADDVLARLAGDECIGAGDFPAFLLAVGPQAVGSLPGVRYENHVDLTRWRADVEAGRLPLHLAKCALFPQRDMALWTFPLRWEGLSHERLARMRASGALTSYQEQALEDLVSEGLVTCNTGGYVLTILGEVFMGQLVRDLKQEAGRAAVDAYIEEGHRLASAIAAGKVRDENAANNRQATSELLQPEPPRE
jgi:coproporphyrinogen III oxidase-like Fe-S oxidoreductase